MRMRDLDLRIAVQPDVAEARTQGARRVDAFVKREFSAYLTPAHTDVTDQPTVYAKPKTFVFPSRRQLRSMDAERWVRQRFKAANLLAAGEFPSHLYAIDFRAARRGSAPADRTTIESLQAAFFNASRHIRFTGRRVR